MRVLQERKTRYAIGIALLVGLLRFGPGLIGRDLSSADAASATIVGYPAAAFGDAMGLGISVANGPYTNIVNGNDTFSYVRSLLRAARITHIRQSGADLTEHLDRAALLAGDGVDFDLLTSYGDTADVIERQVSRLPSHSVRCLEAINEPNIFHNNGGAFASMTRSQVMDAVYPAATSLGLHCIAAPTPIGGAAAQAVGNLSAYLTVGNMHNYFGNVNPETRGWGPAHYGYGYGSFGYNKAIAGFVSGDLPLISTETGYYVTPSLPEDIEGIYYPRAMLQQFLNKVKTTYFFSLMGNGPLSIIRPNYSQRPAYHAMASLGQILYDPSGSKTASCVVPLQIVPSTPSVPFIGIPFCKSSGEIDVVLWQPVRSWDQNTKVPLRVKQLFVSFITPLKRSVRIYTQDPTSGTLSLRQGASNLLTQLPVDDHLEIVAIGGAAVPVALPTDMPDPQYTEDPSSARRPMPVIAAPTDKPQR